MDVEKAISFILEQQARHDERQAQFERGLNGLRKLVQMGMRMMVKFQESQGRTDAELKTLIEAQKRKIGRAHV